MLGVEGRAELRREHFVRGVSIKELARRTGLSRNTERAASRSDAPPVYDRPAAGSKLDPFKDEIHRLLKQEPRLTGVRVRELLEPLGCRVGKPVVDDYLREVRPLFLRPARTVQRTLYRPGEICQFDVWPRLLPAAREAGRVQPVVLSRLTGCRGHEALAQLGVKSVPAATAHDPDIVDQVARAPGAHDGRRCPRDMPFDLEGVVVPEHVRWRSVLAGEIALRVDSTSERRRPAGDERDRLAEGPLG
jgi:hypothetical protein